MPDPFNVGAAARGATQLASIAKIIAGLKKVQAANTTGLNTASTNNGGNRGGSGGGGGGGAAPVSTLASLPQTPELAALIKSGMIKEGMPPEQALAILQVQGMLTGLPIDIAALKKEITGSYEDLTGDITTAGADWMKQMMGANAPTDPAMLAMFQADPMFTDYAGGITQMDETADTNLATDLAWFDKQQQAMNDYYSSLQLGIANGTIAGPAATGGGGGGGGGGRRGGGYGGGGGGGGDGYGDHNLGFGDQQTTLTGQQQIKESTKDSWDEHYPEFYNTVQSAFEGDPEGLLYATDILEQYNDPEDVLAALSLSRQDIDAKVAAAQEINASNTQWEAGLPLEFENERAEYLERTGQKLGDDPATEDVTEWIYRDPESPQADPSMPVSTDPRDQVMFNLLTGLYAPESYGTTTEQATPERMAGLVSSMAEVKRLAGNAVSSPSSVPPEYQDFANVMGNFNNSLHDGPPVNPPSNFATTPEGEQIDPEGFPYNPPIPGSDDPELMVQNPSTGHWGPQSEFGNPLLSAPVPDEPEPMDLGALLSNIIGGGGQSNTGNTASVNQTMTGIGGPQTAASPPQTNMDLGAILSGIIGGGSQMDDFGGGEFPSDSPPPVTINGQPNPAWQEYNTEQTGAQPGTPNWGNQWQPPGLPSNVSAGFMPGPGRSAGGQIIPNMTAAIAQLAQQQQQQPEPEPSWGNPNPSPQVPPELLQALRGQEEAPQEDPTSSGALNQALAVVQGLEGRSVSDLENPALTPEEWQQDWINSPMQDIEGNYYQDDPNTMENESIRADALRALRTASQAMIPGKAFAAGFEGNQSGIDAYLGSIPTNEYYQNPETTEGAMSAEQLADAAEDRADLLKLQGLVRGFDPWRQMVNTARTQDTTASQTYTAKAVAKSYADALIGLGLIPNINTLNNPSDVMVAPEGGDDMPESLEPQEPEEYLPPDEYADYMDSIDDGGIQGYRTIEPGSLYGDRSRKPGGVLNAGDTFANTALQGAGQMDLINNAIKAANAQKIAQTAQRVSRGGGGGNRNVSSVQRNQISDVVKGLSGVKKLANILKGFK